VTVSAAGRTPGASRDARAPEGRPASTWARSAGVYAAGLALCCLLTPWVLELDRADLRVPFSYNQDGLFYSTVLKSVIDTGWYGRNRYLGMPWASELQDFPQPDTVHLLGIKFASYLTRDYATILNVAYLLTYPLTMLASLLALRQLGASTFPAIGVSLLFTFIPFHVMRDEHHIQYSVCYPVPLLVMVAIWVCADAWARWRALAAVAIAMLVASTGGVYFAFFGCFLLLLAAAYSALGGKRRASMIGLGLAAVISITLVANLFPSILYRWRSGDVGVTRRLPEQAEIYGLKIAQMILPVTGHRVPSLAALKERYNGNPLINENDSASLGVVGAAGFIGLLAVLLRRKARWSPGGALLDHLSVLNIGALLFGTIGGLGAVFAISVTPQIRHYNRISLFIGFIAYAAVAVWLEMLVRRLDGSRTRRAAARVLIVSIVVLGILDETSPALVSDYEGERAQYESDREFVRRIEAELPPDAMVFEVPFVPFPENGPQQRMFDYDQARGYLHSTRLRWSYAAIKGREPSDWQARVAAMPPGEMADTLAFAGFRGVWVDRQGYPDNAAALEAGLRRVLGIPPIVSGNGRFTFFSMMDRWRRLREGLTRNEIARWRDVVRYPVRVEWGRAFFALQGTPASNSRWANAPAQFSLRNPSRYPQQVTVRMKVSGASAGSLHVTSPLFADVLSIDPTPSSFARTVEVPPGTSPVRFTCRDCLRIELPDDPRPHVFRLDDFRLEPGPLPSGEH
jgi:hypothetical protein